MKILLVSMNFSPELTGIGKYSGEMAEGLVDRGHEVTVVCAPPYYPTWSVGHDYSAGAYTTETPRPGLTIRRCPVWIPDRLTGLKRLVHLASFALSSLPVLLNLVLWQPRIVFVVAPGLFTAPGAWLAARLSGAKAWLHIQDFEVDAAFELGMLKQPLARHGALWAERWLMRRFDAVSTISSRMLRQLARKGMPLQHTEVLPNWVDLSRITPQGPNGSSLELRRMLGITPTQIVCLFSGTINRKQGVGVLIEAARRLKGSPELVFVICGNGEVRPSLEAAAADLPNVRFIDLQPADELNALLNMADIHLLPQLSGAADLVMPSKLAGMLASGRPVVAAAIPGTEIASIVVGCGIVTQPECPDGFVEAIIALASDRERRQRLGAAARAYAERVLDAELIFDRLDSRLAQVDRRSGPVVAPQGTAGSARPMLVVPVNPSQALTPLGVTDESK
jgi:colanic acid biosynthesis glycosyl transferase WcaI